MQEYKHTFQATHDTNEEKDNNIIEMLNRIKSDIYIMQTQDIKKYSIKAEVFGMIQGVGFRPFVASLAHTLYLHGCVYNQSGNATIIIHIPNIKDEKYIESIMIFYTALIFACGHKINNHELQYKIIMQKAITLLLNLHIPKQAFIQSLHYKFMLHGNVMQGFSIIPSITNIHNGLEAHIPLDTKICNSCLQDMYDKNSRFYEYPFTTCVNCGARYSILYKLPYDRVHTSMNDKNLCMECKNDYMDLYNRRFHTEPISCNSCSIKTSFYSYSLIKDSMVKSKTYYNTQAIKALANTLVNNKIILFKGLGGFAYIANARDTESLRHVRSIKSRKHKPFVVMSKLSNLRNIAIFTPEIQSLLQSMQSPIVIAPKHPLYNLSDEVSKLQTIGIMIPYTAMLDLLFSYLPDDFAIIYTSANNKGDMIASNLYDIDLKSIMRHISEIFILEYDRAIVNKVDDSIVLGIDTQSNIFTKDSVKSRNKADISSIKPFDFNIRSIRLSRSFTPLNLTSKLFDLKLLGAAFGAMQKSSLAFGKGNHMVVSPYMGDLFTPNNIENFRKNFDYFSDIYGKPQALIADKHPNYASTNIAKEISNQNNIPLFYASHHHSHFNSLLIEAGESSGVGVIFDGSGLGDYNMLWGGEFFSGDFTQVKRMMYFKPFMILGGEQHVRDCRRLAYSYALCNNISQLQSFIEATYREEEYKILQQIYKARLNSPLCNSVGRLFDIAAFILGLQLLDYEAQSGEMIASEALRYAYSILSYHSNAIDYNSLMQTFMDIPYKPYPFNIENNQIDMSECILAMLCDRLLGKNECEIAINFIDTLSFCILESLLSIGTDYALFGGGVFANYALCIRTQRLLKIHNIKTFFPQLPCNDYSISIGQLAHLQKLI